MARATSRSSGAGRPGPSAVSAGVAAQIGGLVWILQWAHALVAHGVTSVNIQREWLGMTWLDSAQYLAFSFLLLIPGVVYLHQRLRAPNRAFRLSWVVGAALVFAGIGTALEFGLYERGSYATPDTPLLDIGGVAQALSSLLLTITLGVLTFVAARRQVVPWWLVPVLIVGALATVFPGGPNFLFGLTLPPLPGLAWLAFGGWLLTQHAPERPESR